MEDIGEKDKILEELKELRDAISKKDSEINSLEVELRENIDKTFSEKEKTTPKLKRLREETDKLKDESKIFFEKYSDYLEKKSQLTKQYKKSLLSLKKKYQVKIKERDKQFLQRLKNLNLI